MKKKNWFTMVEIILILVIIATALITIIQGISKTTQYISEMRQRTIALNLAKEGIEAVYNIRDTNWRRRSANRDQCWLKANPMIDEGGDGCENDLWLWQGRYALFRTSEWNSNYYMLEQCEGPGVSNSIRSNGIEQIANRVKKPEALKNRIQYLTDLLSYPEDPSDKTNPRNYLLHSINGERVDHQNFNKLSDSEKQKEEVSLGRYRRFITWDWLYNKDYYDNNPTELLGCKGYKEKKCISSDAKEFRFCSTVIYSSPYQGIVNLCAIMTNFVE